MPSRRQFTKGLVAATAAMGLLPFSAPSALAANASLHGAARLKGRYFGTAVRMDQIEAEPGLRAQVARQCGWMTPEIHLKWNSIENKEGQFWFEPVDKLVAMAREHGMDVHGHTLLWEQGTPDWALRTLRRNRDWRMVENHIERVMSRYGNTIFKWDVVNEPIDTQTGSNSLRRNTFFECFGPTYIERALKTARDHGPNAHLMINDYSFEYSNYVEDDRRAALLRLIASLKASGAPLDGIGLQAHLDLGKGPLDAAVILPFLRAIADFGLDIVITELDVKERDYRASPAIRDQRVADEAARYLDIVLREPAVKGVITWGLSDRHSWLKVEPRDLVDVARYGSPAPNRGLPFDIDLVPKPMYDALGARLAGGQRA